MGVGNLETLYQINNDMHIDHNVIHTPIRGPANRESVRASHPALRKQTTNRTEPNRIRPIKQSVPTPTVVAAFCEHTMTVYHTRAIDR
jgi:hypothetical protein